jgi:hypothetical protein
VNKVGNFEKDILLRRWDGLYLIIGVLEKR